MRLFDVAGATMAGALAAPLWVLVAATIRVVDGPPVLYRSVRTGRGGTPFVLYKFRTMQTTRATDSSRGPRITALGDARVTRVGTWLRRTKLDEVPQLWNVLRGDMSLVGPRPEDPWYTQRYSETQRCVLSVRPGLTSPATIAYRHEEAILAGYADREQAYVDEVLPAKLSLDLVWLEQRSLRADLGVIAATAPALFSRRSSGRQSPPRS